MVFPVLGFDMSPPESDSVTASLAHLYQRHHGWLQGWLHSRLGNQHDAADLAQDTYLRLMTSGRMPARGQSRAFLTQIAKGLVVDLYRRRQIEAAYLEALACRVDLHAPSLEERALIIETLMRIDQALSALPAHVTRVFLMSQFEGLTYSAIAARQGISVATVRKYMYKAAQVCFGVLG